MTIKTVGIDLAKRVLQVHAVDERGKVVVSRAMSREQLTLFFSQLTPCLVGMEACSSSHYWGRKLTEMGHNVKLMPPQFVKPYVKTNKNDKADAEAICEAVTRPTMRFVPIKTVEQQAVLSLHRAREGFVKSKRSLNNQMKGLLAEYGVILPLGVKTAMNKIPEVLEDAENGLPPFFRALIAQLLDHLKLVINQIDEIEQKLLTWHRQNEASLRLAGIPGVGPITATAMVSSIGDPSYFKNGRQLAAWLGLVPKQHSSGGKQRLLGISKRGDRRLRTLLVLGARAAMRVAEKKPEYTTSWLHRIRQRRHEHISAVALANRNARTIWALLKNQSTYDPGHRDFNLLAA